MLAKRIILIVVSMILGGLLTAAICIFALGTTVAEFGIYYFTYTTFSFGVAITLTLDKFVGTNLLPK
jgi:hypothetical protein